VLRSACEKNTVPSVLAQDVMRSPSQVGARISEASETWTSRESLLLFSVLIGCGFLVMLILASWGIVVDHKPASV
jgi:hypothetical protein